MDTADSNVNLIEVPAEDTAIPVALENLDRMISAWAQEARNARRSEEPAVAGVEAAVELPQAPPESAVAESPTEVPAQPHLDSGLKTIDVRSDQPTAAIDQPDTVSEAEAVASAEEDEALLDTLDANTARAIRIRRRLCNNSKSVRELLEELS